jgi:Flp pilus assembly pilin Flp
MIRRLARDESGAVAVIFAIVFLVIVGVAALAVDVGYWYTAKRQLQSAADAAALAGCNELAQAAGDTAVRNTAADYAARNFTAPLEALKSRVESTEIGSDYVKVTAATDAHVFLSQWLLNRGETLIRAQSVAKIGYLAGGRAPVPWGLAILNIDNLSGTLGGQTITFSEDPDDGYWEGTFSDGKYGSLVINATNEQGYVERFPEKDAAAKLSLPTVAALSTTGRIQGLDVNRSTFTSGVDTTARVTVTLATALAPGGKVEMTINGKGKVNLGKVTDTLYRGDIGVGTTADPYESLLLAVTVSEGKDDETAECRLLLRRANYILQDVDVHPMGVLPTQNVTARVKTLTFDYGVQYEMKVAGGAGETGNYLALDFSTLDHEYYPCGYTTYGTTSGGGGSGYKDNIAGNSDVVVHIHDLVTTETGNMTGPTKQGIKERLAGINPLQTLEQWEAAGRPETKQLCIVPIVERIERTTGQTDVLVVNFATLFLESELTNNDTVWGRFIEWTAPGWFVVDDPPPGGLVIEAVHLTDTHLDF